MSAALFALVLASASASASASPAVAAPASVSAVPVFARPDILVWRVTSVGAPPSLVQMVSSTLTANIGANPHVHALSVDEVKAILDVEAGAENLGKEPDGKLLASVAKRASAELIVLSTASRSDTSFAVDLGIYVAADARAVKRVRIEKGSTSEIEKALAEQANALVDSVLEKPAASLAELASSVMGEAGPVQAAPFVIAVGSTATPFSSRFGVDLAQAVMRSPVASAPKKLVGSYRVNRDVIEIAWAAGDKHGQARLLKGVVDDKALAPPNLDAASKDQALLEPATARPDFTLDAWTDKGSAGVVFTEGEEMKLWVKTNKAAHVRVLYHLADGTRTVVGDDFYVDAKQAGSPVLYPQTFEPAPPFGIERIQVVAFAEKPTPLVTEKRTIQGVTYDVVPNLDEAVRHRGYMKRDKLKVAEALVTLTTLPR